MLNVLPAIIFVILWIATFIPAWFFLIKIALVLKNKPIKMSKLIILFIVYEVIIILPYLALLWYVPSKESIWAAFVFALIVLAAISSILQAVDLNRIKRLLWNVYARFYDSLLHFYPYEELVSLVSKRSLQYIHEDVVVADIGCGTGNVSVGILNEKQDIHLELVEPSNAMLSRARHKVEKLSLAPDHINYFQLDAIEYLQSKNDKSIDIAILSNVLYTVLDRKMFWMMLSAKLKDNGAAVITNSDRTGSRNLIQYHIKHSGRLSLLNPGLIVVGVIDNFISQLSDNSQFLFSSRDEIEKELRDTNLEMHDVDRCYGGKIDGVNLLFTIKKRHT